MHCEDNGKLRTPLNEVCMTTDIGCVPIVNGQPTCKPQPDELPIAYDKSTSTLWLFSCDKREWIAHKKFTMDELQDLNLENLNNICSILKIGVFYNPGTGTIQGNVSLGEFAEQLLKCLDLETKVVTVTQGENNTIKISIEGLDGLPPTYVKGDNVWFTGTGKEGDPIIVHTYDPICKWPVASQSAVDAATTKHLGACLDGQPVRVPYPPEPCEYPSFSKAQVDAAGEKRLIACVDGESVKVPWIETPCEYEQKTQDEVDAAASKNLIACVDGEAVKVPYPKYQPPVCESDQITLEQASAAGSSLTLLGCEDRAVVRIPVSGSGFFDRDYICVPTVISAPTSAPLSGTGPLRIGCNGELYVWICESEGSGKWEEIKIGNLNSFEFLNESSVPNICENFQMLGWYSYDYPNEDCVKNVKFTLSKLVDLISECAVKMCHSPFAESNYYVTIREPGDRSARPYNVNLVSLTPYNYNIATYQSNIDSFVFGNWQWIEPKQAGETVGETEIILRNNTDCRVTYTLDTFVEDGFNESDETRDYWVSSIAALYATSRSSYNTVFRIGSVGSLPNDMASIGYYSKDKHFDGRFMHIDPISGLPTVPALMGRKVSHAPRNVVTFLDPGESKTYYLGVWMTVSSKSASLVEPLVTSGTMGHVTVRAYRGLKF